VPHSHAHAHAHALDGEPAVGTRLRVHPGHVCPVVARCPALHLPDGTRWQPIVRPDRP